MSENGNFLTCISRPLQNRLLSREIRPISQDIVREVLSSILLTDSTIRHDISYHVFVSCAVRGIFFDIRLGAGQRRGY